VEFDLKSRFQSIAARERSKCSYSWVGYCESGRVFQGTSLFNWNLSDPGAGNPFRLSFDTDAGDLVFGGKYPDAVDAVVWGDDSDVALGCGGGKVRVFRHR
jgi:hypothetical protein